MGKKKEKVVLEVPSLNQLESELKRERYQKQYGKTFRSTIYMLVTVAAVAVLVATLWLPVLKMYGNSMTPTLQDGDIVIALKDSQFETGDVVAFYYNNKILVKRVIAQSGEWIDIEKDGTLYVNNLEVAEPYIDEKALGDCNIKLPYQVPDSRIFVMGDHRSVSIDSRNSAVGCVAKEQVVGKLAFRIWPLSSFGKIE